MKANPIKKTIDLILGIILAFLILFSLILFFAVPEASAGTVTLAWGASSSSDVAGYRLYWGTTPGGPYPNKKEVGNVLRYTLIDIDPFITFYYVATAYDMALPTPNESAYSNEVEHKIYNTNEDQDPPEPPGSADQKYLQVVTSTVTNTTTTTTTDTVTNISIE